MAESQIRQTAFKVWISDLVNGEYVKQEGEWTPNFVQIKDMKVSRVNIVASVIMKYKNDDSSHISLTLDDGSENISLKSWNEETKLLEDVEIGDIILTIARAREYNGKIYLTPEIVRKLDKTEWMKLRKLELMKEHGERKPAEARTVEQIQEEASEQVKTMASSGEIKIEEEVVVEEAVVDDSPADRQKILDLIESNDSGDGVEITDLAADSNLGEEETNSIIQEMLKEGEIFEIKPGKLKLIE